MRHLLLLPTIAAIAACSSYREIEADAGWADVRLGIGAADLGGELLRDEGTGDTLYRRAQEPPRYGRAPVGGIRYHFYDDVLWKIEIKTGSSKDFLAELRRHYGTPSFNTPWQWDGPTVRMNFLGTEYDSSANITIVKKPIAARREAERPERLERARAAQKAEADRRIAEQQAAQARAEAERQAAEADGEEPGLSDP